MERHHGRDGTQGAGFGESGCFADDPEAGVVHPGEGFGAAADGDGEVDGVDGGSGGEEGFCDGGGGDHCDGGGALGGAHEHGDEEDEWEGEGVESFEAVGDIGGDTGLLEDASEGAASADDEEDGGSVVDGGGDGGVAVAAAPSEEEGDECADGSEGECHVFVAEGCDPWGEGAARFSEAFGERGVEADEEEWEDDGNEGDEEGRLFWDDAVLGFLGGVVGHFELVVRVCPACEENACEGGTEADEAADGDHGAEGDSEFTGDEERAGCGGDEGMGDGASGDGAHDEQEVVAFGLPCDGFEEGREEVHDGVEHHGDAEEEG